MAFPSVKCATLVVLPMFLLSGCATKNVPHIEAKYYGECVRPLVRMQEADSRVTQATAQAALGGALAGAVIGLMVTASNPYALPLGLGVGLAAGAALGAGVGYTYAKLDQIADENTRFASIRVTANQDLSKANRLQLYCYDSMQCYMHEFEKLKLSYEHGQILKEEYRVRFQEIYSAMNALGKIIGSMDRELARTEGEFQHSLASTPGSKPPAPKQDLSRTKEQGSQAQRAPKKRRFVSSSNIAASRERVRQAQAKNDADLTLMLSESAGRVTPPKQEPQRIKSEYGQGYAKTRAEVEDLRSTHSEAISIMQDAALEAGIDMV